MDLQKLRTQAERLVDSSRPIEHQHAWRSLTEAVHELEVHQVELEMQNQELREAQQSLDATRERYQELFENAPVGYVMLDSSGTIEQANVKASHLFAQSVSSLRGVPFESFVVGRYRGHWRELLASKQWETTAARELFMRRANGEVWQAFIEGTTDRPETEGTRVVLMDITETRRAHQAVREREQLLYRLIETAPLGIIVLDATGLVLRINDAAAEMLAISAHESIGQRADGLVGSGLRGGFREWLKQTLEYGSHDLYVRDRELSVTRNDGSTFPARIWARGLKEQRRFTLFIQDISDSRQLQRDVLDAVEGAQERIGQDLHDVVGQELTALTMLVPKLSRPAATEATPSTSHVERLREGLEDAIAHVRDVAHGLTMTELDDYGLRTALEQLTHATGEYWGLDATFESDDALPALSTETARQLYRIGQEASANAARHSGGRKLNVSLRADAKSCSLEIRDNGSGFADDCPDTNTMGLRIMRYRAELIGARLSIDSHDDGTHISCLLPL